MSALRRKQTWGGGSLCFEYHALNRIHVDRGHWEWMSWSLCLEPGLSLACERLDHLIGQYR